MPGVEIVDYQERWPREFEQLAVALREALGDLALRIDHIGSTSVPGLAAKDRIDIQISVASLDPIEQIHDAITGVGYHRRDQINDHIGDDHRPPGDNSPDAEWRKAFFSSAPRNHPVNVHVRVVGRRNWRYALLFRDYLRTHPLAAGGYAALKRKLATHPGISRGEYVDIKDPACDIIIAAAEDWAGATGWKA